VRFLWRDCELDREGRTLRRAGRAVRVQPLVLDLLLLLLQHRGRVVSEDVLRRALWRDVQVTDASLRRLVKEARRAVGDDGEKQEQIETIRGRGLRFSAAVATDGWDTSFVGRADVLDALERKLEEVAGGLGGLTLLHGPAGIGKTRTLVELEERASARGFRVLHGAGRAEAEGDAFHPWLDVARELGVAPLFEGRPGEAGSPRAPDADAQKYANFRAASQALARVARERPILIGFDDLQLADRDGLEALRFLAPALVRAPVWILGTYRTGHGARTAQALRTLAMLGADSSTQDLALRGLDAPELQALVRNHLGAQVGEPLAALLSDRADGNPLFSVEIARSLQRDGRSLAAEPAPDLDATLAQGIEPLLTRRLSALPAESQRVLCAASAIGIEFDGGLLQEVEACSPEALAAALGPCEVAGLLEARGPGRWRFSHPLLAEATYAALEAGEAAAAAQHLRIAETLERRGESDPFLLARHFLGARPAVAADRALQHVRAAAEEAWRRSAVADAELWYRKAVALAQESRLAASERCDLVLALGRAVRAAFGVVPARASFAEAAQLARDADDPSRLAVAVLGLASQAHPLGADASVLGWLRAAHAAPCDDVALRTRVASRLGAELLYTDMDHVDDARAMQADALAAARRSGDPALLGRVLVDVDTSEFLLSDVQARLARNEEILTCGRASGDLRLLVHALHEIAATRLELGERNAVDELVAEGRQLAGDHPFPIPRTMSAGMDVMLALLDGRWADARRGIERSDETVGRLGRDVSYLAVSAGQRFLLAREAGTLQRMIGPLKQAQAVFANFSPALDATLGLAHALSSELEPAHAALERVVAAIPRLPRDRTRPLTLVYAAEIAYRTGDRDAAAAIEPELLPHADVGVVGASATAYFGSVAQALGWLAAARGDSRAAVEHFQRALRTHEALRSPPWCERSTRAIEEVRHLRLVQGRAG
jgi:DNA-binding winged helix-turn-helix (wHTH) protein